MRFPTFAIIGAPRTGTTSLSYYLSQHPDVFMPPVKESYLFLPEKRSGRDTRDLHSCLQELFRGSEDFKAVGDATPEYLYSSAALDLMQKSVPDIRLIVVLRNPLERAFSEYCWLLRESRQPFSDYETALETEERKIGGEWRSSDPRLGIQHSFYAAPLERCFQTFSRSQLRIYLFEDLVRKPLSIVQDIFSYVGVDSGFVPDVSARFNEGTVPNSTFSRLLMLARKRLWGPFRNRFRASARKKVSDLVYSSPLMFKPVLEIPVYNRFISIFAEDIERTSHLVSLDLRSWLELREETDP